MTDKATTGGVLAKLRAFKDTQGGEESFTLPRTGLVVAYPTFRSYEDWTRAQRLAGDDATAINLYYIVSICSFDGEKLKANDYRELVPADDHLAISGKLFGNGAPKLDELGNGSGEAPVKAGQGRTTKPS